MQYGVNLLSYVVGWVPWIGTLVPRINFFYYLFESMVQSALLNPIDWLNGRITFSQGLSNFWTVTTESINQFLQAEINWMLSFLPPLPPLHLHTDPLAVAIAPPKYTHRRQNAQQNQPQRSVGHYPLPRNDITAGTIQAE